MTTQSLIALIEDAKDPMANGLPNGLCTQAAINFNYGLNTAINIIKKHQAEQPQEVVERVALAICATINTKKILDKACDAVLLHGVEEHGIIREAVYAVGKDLAKAAIAAMQITKKAENITKENLSNENGSNANSATNTLNQCTCHPFDRPFGPCPQKFAASECMKAYKSSKNDSLEVINWKIVKYAYEKGWEDGQSMNPYDWNKIKDDIIAMGAFSVHPTASKMAEAATRKDAGQEAPAQSLIDLLKAAYFTAELSDTRIAFNKGLDTAIRLIREQSDENSLPRAFASSDASGLPKPNITESGVSANALIDAPRDTALPLDVAEIVSSKAAQGRYGENPSTYLIANVAAQYAITFLQEQRGEISVVDGERMKKMLEYLDGMEQRGFTGMVMANFFAHWKDDIRKLAETALSSPTRELVTPLTECCHAEIIEGAQLCQKCGWSARAVPRAYCEPCNQAGMSNCSDFVNCGNARCITCKQLLTTKIEVQEGK